MTQSDRPDHASCRAHAVSLVRRDLRLTRLGMTEADAEQNDLLIGFLVASPSPFKVVYTAFDGDHFGLMSRMRRYVFKEGYVPANPESIIGYRDSYLAHHTKRGILLDDLAIVRKCDELWVFTDVAPEANAVAEGLAEGALIELLWFLRCKPDAHVRFIRVDELFGDGTGGSKYVQSFNDTCKALSEDQAEILTMIDGLDPRTSLRSVRAILHDPLDAKYMHWLRANRRQDFVPLVLQLAIEVGDEIDGPDTLTTAPMPTSLTAWASLLRIADELVVLPPTDTARRDSVVVEVIAAVWEKTKANRPVIKGEWAEYDVPKVVAGIAWPITSREVKSI